VAVYACMYACMHACCIAPECQLTCSCKTPNICSEAKAAKTLFAAGQKRFANSLVNSILIGYACPVAHISACMLLSHA